MRGAAGVLDGDDLVVHVSESAGEKRAAIDHHVDLVRARSTAARTSASFTSSGAWPAGNAVATDATFTELRRALCARRGRDSDRRTRRRPREPTGRSGSRAHRLRAERRTFPGVSAPSRVVRSIIRIASSSAKSFDSRLIDRFASSAARASRATASTAPTRGRRPPPGSSRALGASVWLMAAV